MVPGDFLDLWAHAGHRNQETPYAVLYTLQLGTRFSIGMSGKENQQLACFQYLTDEQVALV